MKIKILKFFLLKLLKFIIFILNMEKVKLNLKNLLLTGAIAFTGGVGLAALYFYSTQKETIKIIQDV